MQEIWHEVLCLSFSLGHAWTLLYGTTAYNDHYISQLEELLTSLRTCLFVVVWWGRYGNFRKWKKHALIGNAFSSGPGNCSRMFFFPEMLRYQMGRQWERKEWKRNGVFKELITARSYSGLLWTTITVYLILEVLRIWCIRNAWWYPSREDLPLRKGWFYNANDDNTTKSLNLSGGFIFFSTVGTIQIYCLIYRRIKQGVSLKRMHNAWFNLEKSFLKWNR